MNHRCFHSTTSLATFALLCIRILTSSALAWFGFQPVSSPIKDSHLVKNMDTRMYNNRPGLNSDSNSQPKVKKSPIYIPVGPPCSGKTTTLAGIPGVIDISIDDQDGVYLKIASRLFLTENCESVEQSDVELLSTRLHNRSISERIYDKMNDEMRWTTQRLCNQITKDEFRNRIMQLEDIQPVWKSVLRVDGDETRRNEGRIDDDWKTSLFEAVEEFVFRDSEEIFETVDLFVADHIFKPANAKSIPMGNQNENENVTSFNWPPSIANRQLSGLTAASMKLKYLAKNEIDTSLAWGNTNARSRDYLTALEAAEESGRPIHFLPYANFTHLDVKTQLATLPRVGVKDLIRRNIKRYRDTGRFIPTKAIVDTNSRVDKLMLQAMNEMKNSGQSRQKREFTKFDLDTAMVNMVGFRMREDRTVYRSNKNRNNYRNPGGRTNKSAAGSRYDGRRPIDGARGRGGEQSRYQYNGGGRGRGTRGSMSMRQNSDQSGQGRRSGRHSTGRGGRFQHNETEGR